MDRPGTIRRVAGWMIVATELLALTGSIDLTNCTPVGGDLDRNSATPAGDRRRGVHRPPDLSRAHSEVHRLTGQAPVPALTPRFTVRARSRFTVRARSQPARSRSHAPRPSAARTRRLRRSGLR